MLYQLKSLKDQNVEIARQLRPGHIVKLQYNPNQQRTDVYYQDAYLGGIAGELTTPYAVIKHFEPLVKKTNFTFELLNITEEEAATQEQSFREREEEKKKEIEKMKKTIRQPIAEKQPEKKGYTTEDIIKGHWFNHIAKAYDFHRIAKEQSITSFFGGIFNAFAGISEEDEYKEWLHKHIHMHLRSNPKSEELQRLDEWNQKNKLFRLMEKFRHEAGVERGKRQEEISRNWSTHTKKRNYGPRQTHCWNCGRTIGSDTHRKCSRCKWIVCSCGACSQGCA